MTAIRHARAIAAGVFLVGVTGCAMYTKGVAIPAGLPNKRALVVMDIQNDFVERGGRLPVAEGQAATLLRNVNLLVTAFRATGADVVYVGNEFSASDRIGNWFRNGAAIKGTSGAELSKRLNVVSGAYFPKKHPDAFSSTQFDSFLRQNNVTEILLAGVFADQCVLSTARGAIQRGYSVVTVSDAMAAKNHQALQDAIQRHRSSGARIARTEDVLAGLPGQDPNQAREDGGRVLAVPRR